MMSLFTKLFSAVLLFFPMLLFSQVNYEGPEAGSSFDKDIVDTENFFSMPIVETPRLKLFNKNRPQEYPFPESRKEATAPEGSNVIIDRNFSKLEKPMEDDTVLVFSDFYGIPQTNSIPPDPYIAVGPEHIIQVVNSRFRITDKEGTTLKTISANNWYRSILPSVSAFDPKVIYDQFAHRWVMVWLHVDDATSESYFLVSVSDDENPLGVWQNWMLPSNVNGSTQSGNWGDYQGVGYDDKAIYITANQFTFGDDASFEYTKLRVLNKESVYSDTSNQAKWFDLWDISYPNPYEGYGQFGIRPARMQTASDIYYLAIQSPFSTKNTFGIYELSDPLTNPSLDGYTISVTQYTNPPNAQQLGGGTPSLDGGSGNLRNEPVYKDSVLYLTHSASFQQNYSGARFLEIDVKNRSVLTDFVLAAPEYYHIYPALAVNAKNDVVLTFSRSSGTEYIGAYFAIVPANIRIPLGTQIIQEGKANYVKTFSGTRNRWGDYNGAWTDPVDSNSFWVFTEYVHDVNTWGTWVAGIRTDPFPNPAMFTSTRKLNFIDLEIGKKDTLFFSFENLGNQDLLIQNVEFSDGTNFNLAYSEEFPITVPTYELSSMSVEFDPVEEGEISDTLFLLTNDPRRQRLAIELNGSAYVVRPVEKNRLYATIGGPVSSFYAVSLEEGSSEELSISPQAGIKSLTISPLTQHLYAIATEAGNTNILRINPDSGDAHVYTTVPMVLNAIAFNDEGILFGVSDSNDVYQIDIERQYLEIIGNTVKEVFAMSYQPESDYLWFTYNENKNDTLYRMDVTNGMVEMAGETGFDREIAALTFNKNQLLGVQYKTFQNSYLFSYDLNSSTAAEIGSLGLKSVTGLSILPDTATSVTNLVTPAEFALEANYPNPFNPATNITYALPASADVKISVYNVLGEEVRVLLNENKSAGYHSVEFNAGKNISSGVYIYRIDAKASDGRHFTESRKMMLLK